MTTTSDKPYEVWANIRIDRPELRDASYAPVPPGTKHHWVTRYATQGAAVRFAESCLRGDEDYASSYVESVQVVQMRHNRSPRTVRRKVERVRNEGRATRQRALIQVSAARRGNVLAFYDGWYCEAVARKTGAVPDAYDGWLDTQPCAA